MRGYGTNERSELAKERTCWYSWASSQSPSASDRTSAVPTAAARCRSHASMPFSAPGPYFYEHKRENLQHSDALEDSLANRAKGRGMR